MNSNILTKVLVLLAAAAVYHGAYAASYTVGVGETLTLDVPSVSLGYVDKAIWACSCPQISFLSKSTVSATIEVTAPFEGYAVVELVYVERYMDYRGFTRANTYTEDFYVSCSGGQDGPSSEAKSISVEPEIDVEIGKEARIYYRLYPDGSDADVYVRNYPGTYFNSITLNSRERYIEGIARDAGIESVTVYFDNENGEEVSAVCNVTVYDPDWITPESIRMKSVLLMAKGGRQRILPVLYPNTATTLYTWETDNKDVAYDTGDGEIYAKDCGTANITVRTSNGLTAVCNVLVVEQVPSVPGMSAALERASEMVYLTETDIIR